MSLCKCSILTPTANGFCSISVLPSRYSNTSRALCPTASTHTSVSIVYSPPSPVTRTALSAPPPVSTATNLELNLTSPPSLSISRRMPATTSTSLSVPMCGLASTVSSSPPPMSANVLSTVAISVSEMPVASLPSEKVPAPPSPNCTLLSGSSAPPSANALTLASRFSTLSPRSSTIGLNPAYASVSAQNSPAGPLPTTTGRKNSLGGVISRAISRKVFVLLCSGKPRFFALFSSLGDSVAPIVATYLRSGLRRQSRDNLSNSTPLMSDGLRCSASAALRASNASSKSRGSVTPLSAIILPLLSTARTPPRSPTPIAGCSRRSRRPRRAPRRSRKVRGPSLTSSSRDRSRPNQVRRRRPAPV